MLTNTTVLEKYETGRRVIDIEFLFLDLTTCIRCVGTDKNLNVALDEVQHVLELANIDVQVEKILIETEEQAKAHNFVTSPTIRVNGRDIALEMKESRCDSCTDLCGCAEGTDCRVWLYQGQEYTEAPVGMIVEAVLRETFAGEPAIAGENTSPEDVPDNLKRFFASVSASTATTADPVSPCCSAEKQETCCEPSAKASCCDSTSTTGSCGCQ